MQALSDDMPSIRVALANLVGLAGVLACVTLSVTASGQDDAAAGMNAFFNAWSQSVQAGDWARAEQLAQSQRDIAQKVANTLGGRARTALQANDRESALGLFTLTEKLFEHLADQHGIAVVNSDLGVYHDLVGDCETALPHFIRASDLFERLRLRERKTAVGHGIQVCVLKLAVQDPSLPSIANLAVRPDGKQVVVYNRDLCQKAGLEVCGFYLVHEYAHLLLRHATNRTPAERSEPEADCWAAKHVSIEFAKAAHAWFVAGASSPALHGGSGARAEGIRRCAGL